MALCPNCGASNTDGSKFCMYCGGAMPADAAPAAQPAPAQETQPAPQPAPVAAPVQQTVAQPVQPQPQPQQQYQPQPAPVIVNQYNTPQDKTDGCAVAGFVVSLVSLLCCGFTSFISLILSIIGLVRAGKPGRKGKGLAIAGLIISIILLLCNLGWIISTVVVGGLSWNEMLKEAGIDNIYDLEDIDDIDDEDDDDIDDDDDDGSVDTGWVLFETEEDDDGELVATITYTDGIPDDFVVYGDTTFGDVCTAISSNISVSDPISGQPISFDKEMFRKITSIYFISEDEFDRMGIKDNRSMCLTNLAYFATLAFEFSNDNFDPSYAVYEDHSTAYEYHGVLDANNIGNSVIVFSDASGNQVYFSDAQCGDTVVWTFDFSNPSEFQIGMTADTQSTYPAGQFTSYANYFASLIDPVL